MPSFVIEVYWPGMTRSLADDLVDRIRDAAGEPGSRVRHIGCTVVLRDEVCFVRVDAASQGDLEALVDRLGISGTRVSETVEISGTRYLPLYALASQEVSALQPTKRSGAEAVVERIRVAINGHDLEALTNCFVTDYVNETPVHPERGFRGREQVRRNWEQIFSGVADIRAEVVRVTADGDTAWSEWEMSGSRRDGSPLQMRGVAIYGVADDQAAWCRFYLEPVDERSDDIDSATRRVVTGRSGPAE